MRQDARVGINGVHKVVPVSLDQARFDALVDLTLHRGSIPDSLLEAIKKYWCTPEGWNRIRAMTSEIYGADATGLDEGQSGIRGAAAAPRVARRRVTRVRDVHHRSRTQDCGPHTGGSAWLSAQRKCAGHDHEYESCRKSTSTFNAARAVPRFTSLLRLSTPTGVRPPPSVHRRARCDGAHVRTRLSKCAGPHGREGGAIRARTVGAVAYAVGNHVVFGEGQYAPCTARWRALARSRADARRAAAERTARRSTRGGCRRHPTRA